MVRRSDWDTYLLEQKTLKMLGLQEETESLLFDQHLQTEFSIV